MPDSQDRSYIIEFTREEAKTLLGLVNVWAKGSVARIGDGLLRGDAEVVEAAESTAERVQALRAKLTEALDLASAPPSGFEE